MAQSHLVAETHTDPGMAFWIWNTCVYGSGSPASALMLNLTFHVTSLCSMHFMFSIHNLVINNKDEKILYQLQVNQTNLCQSVDIYTDARPFYGGWHLNRYHRNLAISVNSVAMVMTDVFHKNGIMVSGKLAEIMRIFVDIGDVKNWGVIYWPKRIGPVIPKLWSGHTFSHEFWPKSWPLHSVGITGPILLGQYMTSRFLMCPMSTNILTIPANFPDTIIPFLWKTSVMTVATLPGKGSLVWWMCFIQVVEDLA